MIPKQSLNKKPALISQRKWLDKKRKSKWQRIGEKCDCVSFWRAKQRAFSLYWELQFIDAVNSVIKYRKKSTQDIDGHEMLIWWLGCLSIDNGDVPDGHEKFVYLATQTNAFLNSASQGRGHLEELSFMYSCYFELCEKHYER